MGEAAKSLQRSGDLVAMAGSALLNLLAYAPTVRLHGLLRAITVSLNKDAPSLLSTLKWNADGLIPAIVQDAMTGDVLMMAWMNNEAMRQTIERGETVFYSRSRRTLWRKGETSGHVQAVVSVHVDCDADTVLIKVHQRGGACHLGYRSCFFRRVNQAGELEIAGDPVFDAEVVYRTDGRPVAGAGLALSHAHVEAPKSVIPATDAASPPSS